MIATKVKALTQPRRRHRIAALLASCCLGFAAHAMADRVPWYQPFADDSIWNTPIGDYAYYVDAHIGQFGTESPGADVEYHIRALDKDPVVNGSGAGSIHFPYYSLPNQSVGNTPNNVASYIFPDESLIYSFSPYSRGGYGQDPGGYFQQGLYQNNDVNVASSDTSRRGAHFGSGMSSLGGSIRLGEASSPNPIRHVLKINLPSDYLYNGTPNGDGPKGYGYRWPAVNADGSAPSFYRGANPELAQGSLLAIDIYTDINSLGLETDFGRKIFATMRNYGAYVVDTSSANVYNYGVIELSMEAGVRDEINSVNGYNGSNTFADAVSRDLMKVLTRLRVVGDSSPANRGGEGNRLDGGNGELGTNAPITNGIYILRSEWNNNVIGIHGGSAYNGAQVDQGGYGYQNSQRWAITYVGNGYYRIVSALDNGKVIEVQNSSMDDYYAVVQLYDNYTNDNQLWSFIPVGDGSYLIQARHSGKVLDVLGYSTTSGDVVGQFHVDGGTNQRWFVQAP